LVFKYQAKLRKPLKNNSVSDIVGKWVDPHFDSSLISRCKAAWDKPIPDLTNEELAIFLRQGIAASSILIEARKRLDNNYNDNSEMYEGELQRIVHEIDSNQQNK
jgi:hypothetical protein